MQLNIKVLKGGECQLEVNDNKSNRKHNALYRQSPVQAQLLTVLQFQFQVSDDITVLDLKKEIAKTLNIPVPRQKILSVGRTLVDDKAITSYNTIKNGAKLTVVIKEPEPLKDVMQKIFKKFYTEEQSEALTKDFMLDFAKRMDQLSLDDIERLATYFLERDRQLYGET